MSIGENDFKFPNGQMSMGEALRFIRERNGLTIIEVAKRAHIHRNYLASIENGKANPTFLVVCQIWGAFGYTFEFTASSDREVTKCHTENLL